MGGWCKAWYNNENNKLEGLHQRPDQMEGTRWEGQNFSEVVASQKEEEDVLCAVTIMSLFVYVSAICDAISTICAELAKNICWKYGSPFIDSYANLMFSVVEYPNISPLQRILLQHINLGTELNFEIACKVCVCVCVCVCVWWWWLEGGEGGLWVMREGTPRHSSFYMN